MLWSINKGIKMPQPQVNQSHFVSPTALESETTVRIAVAAYLLPGFVSRSVRNNTTSEKKLLCASVLQWADALIKANNESAPS
jgi:hypothetical protein